MPRGGSTGRLRMLVMGALPEEVAKFLNLLTVVNEYGYTLLSQVLFVYKSSKKSTVLSSVGASPLFSRALDEG